MFTLAISGTAILDTDYTLGGTLLITIPPGGLSASTTLSLTPNQDVITEGSETIILTASTDKAFLGAARVVTLTLTDDDVVPADLNASGAVDIDDAKILLYAMTMEAELGNGDDMESGNPASREAMLRPLNNGVGDDMALRRLLSAANALDADMDSDDDTDAHDAAMFYYALALPAALDNPALRMNILGRFPNVQSMEISGILVKVQGLVTPQTP